MDSTERAHPRPAPPVRADRAHPTPDRYHAWPRFRFEIDRVRYTTTRPRRRGLPILGGVT